jgi:DNA-directed RNA polymerase subunit RPC12/RpoP
MPTYTCQHCSKELRVTEIVPGKSFTCPGCMKVTVMAVPMAKVAPSVPSAYATQPAQESSAIRTFAFIAQLIGVLMIVAAFPAALHVASKYTTTAAEFGWGVGLALAGGGLAEFAFGELLLLFVRLQKDTRQVCERLAVLDVLQANTQFMCDRLAALERLAIDRLALPAGQAAAPVQESVGVKSDGIVQASGS